jgi:hypothetical protein
MARMRTGSWSSVTGNPLGPTEMKIAPHETAKAKIKYRISGYDLIE